MSINYTYEIASVDTEARCMVIIYTAVGYPTQHIGARLPFTGESLEYIVRMYSPTRYWEELQLVVVLPGVGVTGAIMEADEALAASTLEVPASQPVPSGTQTL